MASSTQISLHGLSSSASKQPCCIFRTHYQTIIYYTYRNNYQIETESVCVCVPSLSATQDEYLRFQSINSTLSVGDLTINNKIKMPKRKIQMLPY